jgi:hypothetical protein
MIPHFPTDMVLGIEAKWFKKDLQDLAREYFLDPAGDKEILVEKLLYIGALNEQGDLTELPVEAPSIVPYLVGPPKKFCCRICGACAPADLLEGGKFFERIEWLREHYKIAHPGKWGRGKSVPSPMTESYKEYTPKLPWEMTREQYYEPVTLPEHWKSKGFKSNTQKIEGARGYRVTITTPDGQTLYQSDHVGLTWMRAKYKDDHRDKVKDALAKGLPVPPRVLADYPDLQGSALPATLWASPVRKEIDNLERMWKNSPEAFYRNLKYYKDALKERKEGKGTQKFTQFSISDLEQIVKEADKLYR